MEKLSVKKPFTILVAVIMVLVLGVVSLMNMTADLLPNMSLPYLMVVTTYPGASPERVESDVKEIKADVKALNGRPAKRWDSVVEKALLTVVAALVGWCLVRLGIG